MAISCCEQLHREIARTYSNGDPSLTTAFDQSSCLGLASCANIGHRTSGTDGAGSEQWSYQVDPSNQRSVHVEQRTTSSGGSNITKTSTYYLDLGGNVFSVTCPYPTGGSVGRVVNYTFDAAGRPSTAVDGSNGITYATGYQPLTSYDATGTVTISGTEQSAQVCTQYVGENCTRWTTRWDTGTVSVTVNGHTDSVSYSSSSTASSIASALAGAINGDSASFVTATPSGTTITLFSKATGQGTSYPFSATSATNDPTDFGGPSFSTSTSSTSLQYRSLAGCNPNAACYTPQGAFYGLSIGVSSAFGGLNLGHAYNNRLQPLEFSASSSGGAAMDITYSFVDPASGKNAGHVYAISNNLNADRSQSFSYDQLNRIISAGTQATTGQYCWGYQHSYDAWGNLLAQAGWTPNYSTCQQGLMGNMPADAANHVYPGFSYDAAGNTMSEGVYLYTWDAESQMTSAAGVNYSYDGDGRRVYKLALSPPNGSSGKLYWYGSGDEILAETDASGNTTAEYIFFGGKRIAMIPSSGSPPVAGSPQFYVEDFLGSSRVVTQSNGVPCYDADFTPFGGERTYTNSCPAANNYKFEGKERDTETQNDDFGARYYSWRFGRWLSADWSAVPVAVPYANLTNPQTLNLYAMLADDPESFADLDGHDSAAPEEKECDQGPGGCNAPKTEQEETAAPAAANQTGNAAKSKAMTPAGLAVQVPRSVKKAIADSVKASNSWSKAAGAEKGGFHEEGGGKNKDGQEVAVPAAPGPVVDPRKQGQANIDVEKSADPNLRASVTNVEGQWHVHPEGVVVEGNKISSFNQGPSTGPGQDVSNGHYNINIVVGAADKKVYFYNTSGQIGEPIKLKDFMRAGGP